MNPNHYLKRMEDSYKRLFPGEKIDEKVKSPLDPGNHPELDTSDFLDGDDIVIYQSLIGAFQWAVSIGRFDVMTAVMTLSSFRAQPCVGHLKRIKRIYAYLLNHRYYRIRFDVREPNHDTTPVHTYDWSNTAYDTIAEELPVDAPEPKGKRVVFTHWYDANLMHDVLSGKSVTGTFHLANLTPMMWYSKKQATSETATYGSEFLAARTCVEQIIDLRNSFRYLGVPVFETSYVFGDN